MRGAAALNCRASFRARGSTRTSISGLAIQTIIGHGVSWRTPARRSMQAPMSRPTALARAREEVLIAEGSDWFWWYGDDHSSEHDLEFDDLFRRHLRNAYRLLQQAGARRALREQHYGGRRRAAPYTEPTARLVATPRRGRVAATLSGSVRAASRSGKSPGRCTRSIARRRC